jgi:hypothetical protein
MIEIKFSQIPDETFSNYLDFLVGKIFKILPISEHNFDTLQAYLESLQIELLGSQNLIKVLREDNEFLSLLSILEYFLNTKDISNEIYKREVFKCINIIKKIKTKYKIN